MNPLNRMRFHWDRKPAAVFAAMGIFVLFMLAFYSDRSFFMSESQPANAEKDRVFTDAGGKQHVVIAIESDPALREAFAESFAYRLLMGKRIAWVEVLLGGFACVVLALYFRPARKTLRAFWDERRQGRSLPQSAGDRSLPGRWIEGPLLGIGLIGLVMALAVAILWGVIVWLDWQGALDSVAGRARTVTLSSIAARTALGSGLCSLVFWVMTEWTNYRMTKNNNPPTRPNP